MSILYRGPSIDASYQVSVHMAEGYQRRRLKCEKLTDDRRRTPSDGKWAKNVRLQITSDYRLHPITWKYVIDYNWLRLQITITPFFPN
jgi:hypothetical protein